MLHIDIESRSRVNLPACGLYVYAEDQSTDLLVVCYAFDDEPVQIWYPGFNIPKRITDYVNAGGEVWAQNAAFERIMFNSKAGQRHGWPTFQIEQMVCTMAMALSMGLPGSLGPMAAALGIPEQKSEIGKRLMMQVSQPREIKPNGEIVWWDLDEGGKRQSLTDYCVQDVIVERATGKRMKRLSAYEQSLWFLDQRINDRGIMVDVPAAFAALGLVDDEKKRLNSAMQIASHNQIASAAAVAQIKDYMKFRHVEVPESLAKKDVIEVLDRIDLPKDVRTILEIRREAGKASTAKLNSMLKGATKDNRLKGMFQFAGANTLRWAGRRVQLQNLKRPSIKQKMIDFVLDNLVKGLKASDIDMLIGSPMDVIGDCIRGFLIASEGKELIVADFSAIEARVLAWLAGQEDKLQLFREGKDNYVYAAADIYGKPIDQIDSDKRQVGKVAELALGFGGGVGAFQTMAKGYGVSMAQAFPSLWERCAPDERDFLEKSYQSNKGRFDEISREEYLASDITKVFWRKANPKIVSYWKELESAAIEAVENKGEEFKAGHLGREVTYKVQGSFLWCKLPSGSVICYPYPEVQTVETPWGTKKQGLTYMSEDGQTHEWKRFKTYGGSLCENITQSVARSLLADSLINLDKAGFPIVAHVHDEIICELTIGERSYQEMEEIMSVTPAWGEGLPLQAKGWSGKRFRK